MTCSVCSHPERNAIDALTTLGLQSKRAIANQYGLTHTSIMRHASHIGRRVEKAVARREEKAGDDFLDGLHKSIKRMDRGVRHGLLALDEGLIEPELAYRLAPSFMAQALKARELLGNATGRLNQVTGAGAVNIALQLVIPRDLSPTTASELPVAIEVQALPGGPSDDK